MRRPARWQYARVHHRVVAERGHARDQDCTDCGGPAAEWSYDGSCPEEQVEVQIGGYPVRFSQDTARYAPRCRPCHRAYDRRVPVSA